MACFKVDCFPIEGASTQRVMMKSCRSKHWLVLSYTFTSFKVKRSKRLPMQTKNNTEFIKGLPQEDSAHHFSSYNKF